jgi:hypothetical protein
VKNADRTSVVIVPLTVSDNGEFSPETMGVVPDWLIVYTVLACVGAAAHGALIRPMISTKAKWCTLLGSPFLILLFLSQIVASSHEHLRLVIIIPNLERAEFRHSRARQIACCKYFRQSRRAASIVRLTAARASRAPAAASPGAPSPRNDHRKAGAARGVGRADDTGPGRCPSTSKQSLLGNVIVLSREASTPRAARAEDKLRD